MSRAESTITGSAVHCAQPLHHLDAVHVGQAQIQDHELGLAVRGCGQARLPGLGFVNLEPWAAEARAQKAADLRIVLDHDDDRSLGAHGLLRAA